MKINYNTVFNISNGMPRVFKNNAIFSAYGDSFVKATLTDLDYPKHKICKPGLTNRVLDEGGTTAIVVSNNPEAGESSTAPPARLGYHRAGGEADQGKQTFKNDIGEKQPIWEQPHFLVKIFSSVQKILKQLIIRNDYFMTNVINMVISKY